MLSKSAVKLDDSGVRKKDYFLRQSTKRSHERNYNTQSTSLVKSKSQSFFENGGKVTDSYYNDHQNIYLKKSRLLSQKSLTYQSKQISFSERRKYNQKKIQSVIRNRTHQKSGLTNKTMSLPSMDKVNKEIVRNRMSSINARKFSKLIQGTKSTERRIKLLRKQITQKRQESVKQDKWMSPFRDTNTFKSKFQGKNVIPKKLEGLLSNHNQTQLKVLNLDRVFRVKNGKLSNVVPIPIVKLSAVAARTNFVKTIKKKEAIHQIIDDFNRLLKITKAPMKSKTIGVRGHNFTKTPTLQQLMGIKLHEYYKSKQIQVEEQQLKNETFLNYNEFYLKQMKKDVHLSWRLIAGLKQTGKFNLQAYIRFFSIFVNKIATQDEKITFLLYFFIPHGQQKIELGILKLILQLMCQQLPQISSLKVQSQLLSRDQKSKIFLEALNRVLFADLKEFTGDGEVMINRDILKMIFQRNDEAVSLLVRLLLKQ